MRGRFTTAIVATALLTGCGSGSDGPLKVAIIGTPGDVFAGGLRLSEGAQTVRGAIGAGLVSLDGQGEIEPALADRWIVTDDGRSYIFRLREGTWPDGAELSGESARTALRQVIRTLQGTSLGLDLQPIEQVRTMAGRVIEIDLKTPMPDLLRLLAQPELALTHGGAPAGPMVLHQSKDGHDKGAELTFRPPEMRGAPQQDGWQKRVRTVMVEPLGAKQALAAFDGGDADVVLGGTIATWPLARPGPLSLGNVRLDNTVGLFGLQIVRPRGFLASATNREALAMAIDRTALLSRFNIGGWVPSTRVVPAALAGAKAVERWSGSSIDQRRAAAASRVAAWHAGAGKGETLVLTVALADEPGYVTLFNELAAQLQTVGIVLERVDEGKAADLVLVDRVARYAAPRWFLNQFNCKLARGLCNSEADAQVQAALTAATPQERAENLVRAEALLTAANVFVPIGAPLRWSMVRGSVTGYATNPWAWHPLPDMATIPR
jgi:oligopeptide transport system substrate-binding protein